MLITPEVSTTTQLNLTIQQGTTPEQGRKQATTTILKLLHPTTTPDPVHIIIHHQMEALITLVRLLAMKNLHHTTQARAAQTLQVTLDQTLHTDLGAIHLHTAQEVEALLKAQEAEVPHMEAAEDTDSLNA